MKKGIHSFLLIIILPALSSVISVVVESKILFTISLSITALEIMKFPCCQRFETMWTFILSNIVFLPVSIKLYLYYIYTNWIQEEYPLYYGWFIGIEYVFIIQCSIVAICCILSRVLFRKQYDLNVFLHRR